MDELFIEEELKEFNVAGYTFKYKPVTAGEENEWLDEYLEDVVTTDENGYQRTLKKTNFSKLNQCKLRNLVEAPFTKDLISRKIGVNKEWRELNKDERWAVLEKLKPDVFSEILNQIDKIDKGADTKKRD